MGDEEGRLSGRDEAGDSCWLGGERATEDHEPRHVGVLVRPAPGQTQCTEDQENSSETGDITQQVLLNLTGLRLFGESPVVLGTPETQLYYSLLFFCFKSF